MNEQRENEPAQKTEESSETTQESKAVEGSEESEPVDEKPSRRYGCIQGCLIPLALIFTIVLIIIVGVYVERNSISDFLLKRIISNTENHVLVELPEDISKDEVTAIFETVRNALGEDQIDEEALRKAMEEYHEVMKKEPEPEAKKQEIIKLISGLNAAITGGEN